MPAGRRILRRVDAISLGTLLLNGQRIGISGHVDVWKNDGDGEPDVLVHTSRPCVECGLPLTGAVIPVGNGQAHAACRVR